MLSLRSLALSFFAALPLFFVSCSPTVDHKNQMVVSVRDQKLLLVKEGKPVKAYPVSTSKFGLGSQRGSNRTPLGKHVVAKKIGAGAHKGEVFKSRRRTGRIMKPNTYGGDPIVTRILWLSGRERHNRNTFSRCIYIHGTPAENKIGRPASYGCIRMKSRDIIDLYRRVSVGAGVQIIRGSLDTTSEGKTYHARWRGRPRANATRW